LAIVDLAKIKISRRKILANCKENSTGISLSKISKLNLGIG
jgi:hypothetical protein